MRHVRSADHCEQAPALASHTLQDWRPGLPLNGRAHRRPQRVSRCPRSFRWGSATSGRRWLSACDAKTAPEREVASCCPRAGRNCRHGRALARPRTPLLCVQPGTVGREEEYYPRSACQTQWSMDLEWVLVQPRQNRDLLNSGQHRPSSSGWAIGSQKSRDRPRAREGVVAGRATIVVWSGRGNPRNQARSR
jgi:hypothetical protein